jgi:hypothetical protein
MEYPWIFDIFFCAYNGMPGTGTDVFPVPGIVPFSHIIALLQQQAVDNPEIVSVPLIPFP